MQRSDMEKIVVLIPAYKPDERLITLTKELKENGFPVLLVDDGGGSEFAHIFEDCRALGAEVAVHPVNRGKGRALKTGIEQTLVSHPDAQCIVTADSDGQHTVPDIIRVAEACLAHPADLILGARAFTGNVPFKSRWGNRITRWVYRLASGMAVTDTQTGLRGLPACSFAEMARIEGERYEYEMNVLLQLKEMHLGVFEVPIETIYINDNSGSHFNPVKDAMRIYRVIFSYMFKYLAKYLASSVISFVIDYALYWLLLGFGLVAWLSYALARLVSSQVNYRLNRYKVFDGRGGKYAMLKYYGLVVVQGATGAALVQALPAVLPVSSGFIKIPVDVLLFLISYMIQRNFVFGDK